MSSVTARFSLPARGGGVAGDEGGVGFGGCGGIVAYLVAKVIVQVDVFVARHGASPLICVGRSGRLDAKNAQGDAMETQPDGEMLLINAQMRMGKADEFTGRR